MLLNKHLIAVVLLSLLTCHQSISTSTALHTSSKTNLHIERQDPVDLQSSEEVIDVYRNNEKLVLRCRSFNQTLIFKTSSTDKTLAVHAANTPISSESDIYQGSYEKIFGVYKLPLAYCIAFIKSSEPAKNFLGGEYGVRNIKEISYVVIPTSSNSLAVSGIQDSFSQQSESAKQREAISLMQNTFSRHSFYYSSRFYDVTRNLQSNSFQYSKTVSNIVDHTNHFVSTEYDSSPSWKSCDERFFWNLNVVSDLIDTPGIDDRWITPITNMWVSSEEIELKTKTLNGKIEDEQFLLTLISRRNRRRQGPRYIKRGSDNFGDVANFVETEQVLQRRSDGHISSFVQVRGSIPLFWSQPEIWKLKPLIVPISDLGKNAAALKTHLLDLAKYYVQKSSPWTDGDSKDESEIPSITMINLIDKNGSQGKLGRWLVAALETVQRTWINAFPVENEDTWFLENQKRKALPSIPSDLAVSERTVIRSDEIPFRVESDPLLKNRKIVTESDYFCSLSSSDVRRISGDSSFLGKSGKKKTVSRNGSNEALSISNIKNKFSDIKSSVIQKISSQGSAIKTRFVWFDYHRRCKGGNVDALRELFPSVKDSILGNGGHFSCSNIDTSEPANNQDEVSAVEVAELGDDIARFNVLNVQKNIVRTNCIDCLDRTNVVQTTVARWALNHQLRLLGVVNSGEGAGTHERYDVMCLPNKEAENSFRKLWGKNGDVLSLLYAGTRALKRDVTRHGKRTKQGAFDDGVNSAMRYFINNYQDESRQRGIDILLGFVSVDGIKSAARNLPHRDPSAALRNQLVTENEYLKSSILSASLSKKKSVGSDGMNDPRSDDSYGTLDPRSTVLLGGGSDDDDSSGGSEEEEGESEQEESEEDSEEQNEAATSESLKHVRIQPIEKNVVHPRSVEMESSGYLIEESKEKGRGENDSRNLDPASDTESEVFDYKVTMDIDGLDVPDVDDYLTAYRSRVDHVLQDLLSDIKEEDSNEEKIIKNPDSNGKKVVKRFLDAKVDSSKLKKVKIKSRDTVYKSSRIEDNSDENSISEKFLLIEEENSSVTEFGRNILKYKSILMCFFFAIIMHYSMISGILK